MDGGLEFLVVEWVSFPRVDIEDGAHKVALHFAYELLAGGLELPAEEGEVVGWWEEVEGHLLAGQQVLPVRSLHVVVQVAETTTVFVSPQCRL